jgi:hypothetical protein
MYSRTQRAPAHQRRASLCCSAVMTAPRAATSFEKISLTFGREVAESLLSRGMKFPAQRRDAARFSRVACGRTDLITAGGKLAFALS